MIHSMTGFGNSSLEHEAFSASAEVRTLNSKHLDTYIRLPQAFSQKEAEVKELLSKYLLRGKVNVQLNYQPKQSEANRLQLNKALVTDYFKELNELKHELNAGATPNLFNEVLRLPDVWQQPDTDATAEQHWPEVFKVVEKAVQQCADFRQQEGAALQQQLEQSISNIGQHLEEVVKLDPERNEQQRERLRQQFAEWEQNGHFNADRFEQELIYYFEKLDISEEKVRLTNHLKYFNETLESGEGIGKKLGFISQEIGREINTIGSKAQHAQIQRHVVDMKDELEKIKEQVLNVV
jgi:uncharacterized protein (TIGR00255 family)